MNNGFTLMYEYGAVESSSYILPSQRMRAYISCKVSQRAAFFGRVDPTMCHNVVCKENGRVAVRFTN